MYTPGQPEVFLLPLVEMGTAPPQMLRPVIRFSHRHVYSDNCSCLTKQHSRAMAVIRLIRHWDSAFTCTALSDYSYCNQTTDQSHLWLTSLCHQLPRHSRTMAYEEQGEATPLYILYKLYMIITQTICTIVLLLVVISEESHRRPSTSGSRPGKKSNNRGVLIQLWEIRSSPILVRLRCIHAF